MMTPKDDAIAEIVRDFKEHPEKMKEWKCPYCDLPPFKNHRSRVLHIKRDHHGFEQPVMSKDEELARKRIFNERSRAKTKARAKVTAWNAEAVPYYKTKKHRREKYLEQVARFREQGLTAQGKPFRRKPRGHMSAAALRNVRKAQQERRERERNLNGAAPALAQPATDNMGEAARAIIVAAQVLRSVGIGLKL